MRFVTSVAILASPFVVCTAARSFAAAISLVNDDQQVSLNLYYDDELGVQIYSENPSKSAGLTPTSIDLTVDASARPAAQSGESTAGYTFGGQTLTVSCSTTASCDQAGFYGSQADSSTFAGGNASEDMIFDVSSPLTVQVYDSFDNDYFGSTASATATLANLTTGVTLLTLYANNLAITESLALTPGTYEISETVTGTSFGNSGNVDGPAGANATITLITPSPIPLPPMSGPALICLAMIVLCPALRRGGLMIKTAR